MSARVQKGAAGLARLAFVATPLFILFILFIGGCTVGDGSGSASGILKVVGCDEHNTLMFPKPYSLDPKFFAGDPLEDVCPPPGQCSGPRSNRLVIRLQQTGNRFEATDTLFFDVLNSYEVARCLRGRTIDGLPDWSLRPVTAPDGALIPGLPWCDWLTAGTDGGSVPVEGGVADLDGGVQVGMLREHARINLSTQDWVQSSFAPLFTCIEARSVAVALPGSWIDFLNFGDAEEGGDPNNRHMVPADFKVDFGQRLRGRFHLVMGDQAVQYAKKMDKFIPDSRIDATLDGSFDFDLERGRAAQPFP